MQHRSNLSLDQAAALLQEAASPVVVLTHAKPDGDALGSVLALTIALRHLGKQTHSILLPPLPDPLADFQFEGMLSVMDPDTTWPEQPGLVVVVDTGAKSQLADAASYVQTNSERTLVVDHHLSGNAEAKYRYVDHEAAACCEIIAEMVDRLLERTERLEQTAKRALNDALFLGIASDTGWFRFSNTRPVTLRLAARLLEEGVDHADIYRRTEQCERLEKVRLLSRALESLEVLADGKAALMTLYEIDFEETGAFEHETDRLIDVPQQVGDFELFCVAVEKNLQTVHGEASTSKAQTKLSFRSKPGPNAINVADLAGKFGGGGHARAAGATVEEPIEQVLPALRAAMNQAQ